MPEKFDWKWAPMRKAWLAIDPTGEREPIEIPDANGSAEDGPTEFALAKMLELAN